MIRYLLKSGNLYKEEGKQIQTIAGIKNRLCGSEKLIYVGEQQFRTDIQKQSGNATLRTYILKEPDGAVLMSGTPRYAEGEDPAVAGWPINRMPRVDSTDIQIGTCFSTLRMINNQNYVLTDTSGEELLHVLHRGITGGWSIEARDAFTPELLCGIFVFCRYMEQENEFLVV